MELGTRIAIGTICIGQSFLSFFSSKSETRKQFFFNINILFRYITDVHADSTSAKSSFGHSEGGKEYYWKELKRNRHVL